MLYYVPSLTITLLLGISMILAFLAGSRFKQRRIRKNLSAPEESLGAIEGSLLGLLALILSFTFGMANTRHDNRVQIMANERGCIGTAILRADLFPDSVRKELRSELKGYLTARIDLYDAGIDTKKTNAAYLHASLYGDSLWRKATSMARSEDVVNRSSGFLMVTALNDMFAAAISRRASRDSTLPESILWLQFLLCISSAFIIGYGDKRKKDWVLFVAFALMISITVFSILDLDRPHRGLITLEKTEGLFVELRDALK